MSLANNFLTRLPFPASGLMLAIASLGILYPRFFQGIVSYIVPIFYPAAVAPTALAPIALTSYLTSIPTTLPSSSIPTPFASIHTALASTIPTILYTIFGVIAVVLWLLLLLKMIVCRAELLTSLRSPVIASVIGTFPMATIVLSVYLQNLIGDTAVILWCVGVALHALLIIFFSLRFLRKPILEKLFPSWLVAYVGIVIAPITSPCFSQAFVPVVAHSVLIFGAVLVIILFPALIYRSIKLPLDDPVKPLVCIFIAPVSIILAGYTQCCSENPCVVLAMLILETIILVLILLKLPRLMKLPFYPSYAAFTFPFVVTSTAFVYGVFALVDAGFVPSALYWAPVFVVLLATALVVYVFIRYAMFLFSPHTS